MISQRIAKISLILNGVLTLACFGLLIYALLKKTEADVNALQAIKQTEMAVEQRDMAEIQRRRADSAAMEALRQRDLSLAILDSMKLKNQTIPK